MKKKKKKADICEQIKKTQLTHSWQVIFSERRPSLNENKPAFLIGSMLNNIGYVSE